MNPYLQDILHNITTRLAALEDKQEKKEWVELTDDEYIQLLDKAEKDAPKTGSVFKNLWYAINTKLKEKNND